MTSIFDRTIDLLAVCAGFLIAYLVLSVTIAIILRGLRVPVVWMFEITEYSLLWLTFLGAPWVLRGEGHIKMDLILGRLDPKTQAVLNTVTSIVGAIVCAILTGFGIKVTWDNFQTGYFLHTVLAPPLFPILTIIPIGSFLLFVQFLRRARKTVTGRRESLDKGTGVAREIPT